MRTKKLVIAFLALVIVLFAAGITAGAEQPNPKSAAPASPASGQAAPSAEPASVPSAPTAIPLEEVALKAADVATLLRDRSAKLPLGAQVEGIRDSLADASAKAARDREISMDILGRQPSLTTLQDQQQHWQRLQLRFAQWQEKLQKRSKKFQDSLAILAVLQEDWEATRKSAEESEAPLQSLQLINATIASIHAALAPMKGQLALVLDLQSQVGGEVEQCGIVLAAIAQLQQASVSDIMARDSLPLWDAGHWTNAGKTTAESLGAASSSYRKDVGNYLALSSRQMPRPVGVFALLALTFLAVRNQIRRRTAADESFSPFIRVFEHPVAAALTVTLLVVTAPFRSPLPASIRDTFQILALVPMMILVRQVIPRRLVLGLYSLGFLFAVDALRRIFVPDQLPGQVFLVLESLLGMAAMVWFLRNFRPVIGEVPESSWLRIVQPIVVLILLLLAVGFLASVTGHVRIARITTPGIIAFGVMAIAMYASLRVLIGFVAFAFHIWPLRLLHMIRHHRELLEHRLYCLLYWAAIVGLIVRYLGYIGLLEPFVSIAQAGLFTKLRHGALNISAADVIAFVLTVWAAYLLSAFLRFILREDVYPRIRITRGKSYAVSSLLHYLILTVGFIIAIAVLGVDLTKLTVLTGALGIGIGFGLQSMVNNFVSGLILLFERPIQVGDTVEVGAIQGKVRRIGIRASTVHTRHGADIIVPNSQLISERVTNWTFSDQLKRIDLPVGVSYSSPPQAVIALLEAVSLQNPCVLTEPAPQGLFVGFGESALNFELRAWTDQFDDWPRIQSELAAAIYDAVREAGMTFPFPQREVRLLKDAEGGAGNFGEGQTGKPSPV